MKRNVIFSIPVLFIISSPSSGAGMVDLATGSSDIRNYAVFSFIDYLKTEKVAVYPYV